MAKNNMSMEENQAPVGKSKGPKSRGSSKKNYFSRNSGGAVSNRNKARRSAKAKKRSDYWATPAGVDRRTKKLNTPEKLARREQSLKARTARRRETKLAEQSARKENVVTTVATPAGK